MGRVRPLSEIDKVFSQIPADERFCLIDSNILIAWYYDVHEFNDEAQFVFEHLVENKAVPFASITTRYEFLDFVRRVIITEQLMDMLDSESPYRISAKVRAQLESFKRWIKTTRVRDELPVLPDNKIKEAKRLFTPERHSGHHGWLELCDEFLKGRLDYAWQTLVEGIGINYIDTNKPQSKEILERRPDWREMCQA